MKNKPNVLFIMCDQLRKDALGIYGNDVIKTPNIDSLFEKGVIFSNMFAAHPVCAPNRGAIATGKWPKINGLVSNGYVLPESEITMMDVFRSNGYTTYGVGKFHFTPTWLKDWDEKGKGAVSPQPKPFQMPHYGFDHCLITEDNRMGPYSEYLKRNGLDPWKDLHSFSIRKQHFTQASCYLEEHHQTTWITDRSIEYFKKHDKKKPFFMWTSYVHPHHPFNPPKPYDTMYNPLDIPPPIYKEGEHEKRHDGFRNKFYGKIKSHEQFNPSVLKNNDWQRIKAYYYGMVSQIDKNVGRIMDTLKEIGLFDNTIFVFSSDHGEMLGDHHLMFKPFPFDCVTSVPFLIKTPDMHSGRKCNILCRSLEIMPTLLDVVGLTKPEFLNGISLIDYVNFGSSKELFDDILIEQMLHHSIRSKKYRLTIYHNYGQGELYDLEQDPDNFNNLWDDDNYRQLKENLISQLIQKMYKEVIDPKFRKVGMC